MDKSPICDRSITGMREEENMLSENNEFKYQLKKVRKQREINIEDFEWLQNLEKVVENINGNKKRKKS